MLSQPGREVLLASGGVGCRGWDTRDAAPAPSYNAQGTPTPRSSPHPPIHHQRKECFAPNVHSDEFEKNLLHGLMLELGGKQLSNRKPEGLHTAVGSGNWRSVVKSGKRRLSSPPLTPTSRFLSNCMTYVLILAWKLAFIRICALGSLSVLTLGRLLI